MAGCPFFGSLLRGWLHIEIIMIYISSIARLQNAKQIARVIRAYVEIDFWIPRISI
jgi:hypothetical protein